MRETLNILGTECHAYFLVLEAKAAALMKQGTGKPLEQMETRILAIEKRIVRKSNNMSHPYYWHLNGTRDVCSFV